MPQQARTSPRKVISPVGKVLFYDRYEGGTVNMTPALGVLQAQRLRYMDVSRLTQMIWHLNQIFFCIGLPAGKDKI